MTIFMQRDHYNEFFHMQKIVIENKAWYIINWNWCRNCMPESKNGLKKSHLIDNMSSIDIAYWSQSNYEFQE